MLSLYNDGDTALTVSAERRFLWKLNGGCQVPIGAYATLAEDQNDEVQGSGGIVLTGMVGSPDGSIILKESLRGDDPLRLGDAVANALIARGADEILAAAKG
ncbi:Porphobilinogen deaminase [compost metagenome]